MRFAGLLAGLFAACAVSADAADGFVRVRGLDLVAPDGTKFVIRGTNLGNWLNPEGYMFRFGGKCASARFIDEAFRQLVGPEVTDRFWAAFKANYITEADIAWIAATGANTVRLPFHYRLFTDEDYLGLKSAQDGFAILDRTIGWCRRHGLKVILDMHDCPGGQTGDNIDDSYGYPWLFESEAFGRQYADIWRRIAARYADEPAVLGYDLMNEPISSRLADMEALNLSLERVQQRAARAIREVDANHVLIFGGAQWNSNFAPFSDFAFDANMMYTCHRYWTDPKDVADFVAFRTRSGKPMYMGETGHNTVDWCRVFAGTLRQADIGVTWWPYKMPANGGERTSGWMNFEYPAGWDAIVRFACTNRATYAAIQAARPDRAAAARALMEYAENCRLENCKPDGDYLEATGFACPRLDWSWFKDDFAAYRRRLADDPSDVAALEAFDRLAEAVGISVSERYRMLRTHHAAARTRLSTAVAECRTATVEGDYGYALGLGLDEKLPCVVDARILFEREHARRPEMASVPTECEIPYRWCRGEDVSALLDGVRTKSGTPEAFWVSGVRALARGESAAARADFIRALELKNDFLWAKVMLDGIVPDMSPAVELPRLGNVKPLARPDPEDDQWMIGCELLDRDLADFDAYAAELPRLGIRSARFQCGWAKCERTRGEYDFTWLDRCADFCRAHGMEPVFETDYGNPIYPGGGGTDLSGGFPATEEALRAWDRWVDALTRHFRGRVNRWAMWNEPDIAPLESVYGSDQAKSPAAIAAFNVRTARIVKRNIPDAQIAGLSLNSSDPAFFEACLEAMGEDVGLFDRFIYHGYDHIPESTYANVEKLQAVCARLAPHAKMWQGENGAPSGRTGDELALSHTWWTEGTQATWDLRRMIGDLIHGIPSSVFTICDYYHFGRGIGNFGLLKAGSERQILREKLVFKAVQNCVSVFNSETKPISGKKQVSCVDSKVVLGEFTRQGAPLVVFWFGGARPGEGPNLEYRDFDFGNLAFQDPVWVDLVTGGIFAFPKGSTSVPVRESPCVLTERRLFED